MLVIKVRVVLLIVILAASLDAVQTTERNASCLKPTVVRNTTTLALQHGPANADTGWNLGLEIAGSHIPASSDDADSIALQCRLSLYPRPDRQAQRKPPLPLGYRTPVRIFVQGRFRLELDFEPLAWGGGSTATQHYVAEERLRVCTDGIFMGGGARCEFDLELRISGLPYGTLSLMSKVPTCGKCRDPPSSIVDGFPLAGDALLPAVPQDRSHLDEQEAALDRVRAAFRGCQRERLIESQKMQREADATEARKDRELGDMQAELASCQDALLETKKGPPAGRGLPPDRRALFLQNRWLMNVFSVTNFTHAGIRFGSQMALQMQGALIAKQVGRGWITPGFVDQPRDSKVAEDMMYNGTLASQHDGHPYIITTLPVSCDELFDCRRFTEFSSELLSMEQLADFTTTIDHLIVQVDAGIIGGQACVPDTCSAMSCPATKEDGLGPRQMEFFGKKWLVKNVSCFGGEWGPSMPAEMYHILAEESARVVAVATGAPDTGRRSARDSKLLPLLRLLEPSPAVETLMESLRRTLSAKSGKYVSVHWRRGDRGHPEMWKGEQEPKPWHWRWNQVPNFACIVSRIVQETGVSGVLVMTNAGRREDREALRHYVRRWAGATVVYLQDLLPETVRTEAGVPENLRWERWNSYDVLVAEVLLSAHLDSVRFLSAGPNYVYASTISQLVEELRLARGHSESSTVSLYNCTRPHPQDMDVSISIQARCTAGTASEFDIQLRGLALAVGYTLWWEINHMHSGKTLFAAAQGIVTHPMAPSKGLERLDWTVKLDGPIINYTSANAAKYRITVRLLDAFEDLSHVAHGNGNNGTWSLERTVGFSSRGFVVNLPETE